MYRILVAECMQEVSSFNPVETRYEHFRVRRGEELFARHRGVESYVSGALQVFEARPDVEALPLWGADACSSGLLVQEDFERLAAELIDAVGSHRHGADGFYFVLHGAMGATGDLDPEGFLLQEVRRLVGPDLPLVISLDLHGILTRRMLQHCDALTLLHTYPPRRLRRHRGPRRPPAAAHPRRGRAPGGGAGRGAGAGPRRRADHRDRRLRRVDPPGAGAGALGDGPGRGHDDRQPLHRRAPSCARRAW